MMSLELCGICNTPKSEHEGRQHEWTEQDTLVPKSGNRVAGDRSTPPAKKESSRASDLYASRLTVRLIEVLTKQGLLSPDELFFIFGGVPDADTSTHGSLDQEARDTGT